MSWLVVSLTLACTACAGEYELSLQSIPAAYGNPRVLRVFLEAPKDWKTHGPGRDDIAFQPANCQRPDCPIIGAVLYVGDPNNPIPTQAKWAKNWLSQIDKSVAARKVGSFSTDKHGMLNIYHFMSPKTKEEVVTFVIHNRETVAVTLSNVRSGDFQPYTEALKQVARSIRFGE